ncbi:hypothetical protein Ancab_001152, partial [Ancistrocladus abbreviatus]
DKGTRPKSEDKKQADMKKQSMKKSAVGVKKIAFKERTIKGSSSQRKKKDMQGAGLSKDQQLNRAEVGTGNSITDSSIANMKRLFIQRQAQASAVEVWEFGKRLGVSYAREETEIINRLILMEVCDFTKGEKKCLAKIAKERHPANSSVVIIAEAGRGVTRERTVYNEDLIF